MTPLPRRRSKRVGQPVERFRAGQTSGSNVIELAARRMRARPPEPKSELAAVLRRMIEAAALIREAESEQARELVLDAAEDLLAYARRL